MEKKDYRFEKLNGIIQSLKASIRFIWHEAIKEKKDFDWILTRLKERVYDDKRFMELPQYMRYGIRQYSDAFADHVWHTHLEWVHWYDGKFVGKNLPYGEGFKQELIDSSAHVWAGTEIIYFQSEKAKQNG